MDETFSVCQFFLNDTYEYVRRYVRIEEALAAAVHYATSVAARSGLVLRVIVTDSGDSIVWEWTYQKGITWPPKQEQPS